MRTARRSLLASILLAMARPALAGPPEGADPAWSRWFESLRQPGTGASCCTAADCRITEFRRDLDGYEALVDDRWKLSRPFWTRVPPQRVLERSDNPTGRAVLCFTPEAGIVCFVRPPDS